MKLPTCLVFDVNETLLDLSPVKESVARVLKGKEDLVPLWFTTLLHYSLVTSAAGEYRGFGEIAAAALRMVAANHGIDLDQPTAKAAVVGPMRSLPPHPEVPVALERLRAAGFRLVALTNSSQAGMTAQLKYAGLSQFFDRQLSVEQVGLFKPHTAVYDWAAEELRTPAGKCMLVAAHGWDVAGASWAGWQTAFISRPGQQRYPLAPEPDILAENLSAFAGKLS